MKPIVFVFFACACAAFGQTGRVTGTVIDDSGTPVQGANVAAALWAPAKPIPFVAGRPPAFMPVPANALSDVKGQFQIDGLFAGRYYICVEKPDASILNPCLWADPPSPVDVADGATVSGVSVVAVKGVTVNVRVHDAKGLLQASPAMDDVRVGTYHRIKPFIPGRITGRDPAGKTMSVIVPKGQAAAISVSSSAFVLADEKGAPLANTTISLTTDAVGKAGANPAVTVQVTDTKGGH